MRFSRRTQMALRRSGWFPGRTISLREAGWPAEGWSMSPAASSFLREFGNLEIRSWRGFRRLPLYLGGPAYSLGAETESPEAFGDEVRAGLQSLGQLTPVGGDLLGESEQFFMDAAGKVFGCVIGDCLLSSHFREVGNSPEQALAWFCGTYFADKEISVSV